jgi:tRNA (mo5U34)-methyltransferase
MSDSVEAQVLGRKWFYPFRLPSGQVTDCYLPPDVAEIHRTRETMLFHVLEPLFQGRWDQVRAVDLACHEGYFSFSLAQRGCKEVIGFDARPENLDGPRLMREALGLTNTRFELADIVHLDPYGLGKFDLTVLFGLLYHVNDPVGVLRLARALTKIVCIIETQVVPNLSGQTDWGSYRFSRELIGCFGVVDETARLEEHNREASLTSLSLVPSLPALIHALKSVGFTRVEVVPPPPDAYEQLAYGKRVMVAAFVEPADSDASISQWTMEYQLDMPLRYILAQMQDRTVSQSTYFGVPAQKSPTDFWIYQELIHRLQPDVIVEIGNYCGGSILGLAHLCDLIGKGRVIGVDVSHHLIPPIVRNHPRITLIEGDACARFADVRQLIDPEEHVLVIEDSSHTYENTLHILQTYAALVQVGGYFIVEDGICWHGLEVGPRPGPYEAIETFLATDARFEADRSQESFVITWNPKGYLKRVR